MNCLYYANWSCVNCAFLGSSFQRLAMDKLDPNRFSTANRSVNKNKNRFVNILPCELTVNFFEYCVTIESIIC
jgi:hypothetical protein